MLLKHFRHKALLTTISALLCSTAIPASATPLETHIAGTPLAMSDLPTSPLRAQIAALPASIQTQALARLSRVQLSKADLSLFKVDPQGNIYVVDSLLRPPPPSAEYQAAHASEAALTASLSESETFALHSKPGATNVVYLDFNGHTITNTAWNSSYGVTSWTARPYDMDGSPTTFNTTELSNITSIWRRIAEDYAPFNVDVTTQEPTTLTNTTGRILITPGTDQNGKLLPAGNASGGIAYVGVWGASYYPTYSPAFVYSDMQYNQPDFIAEAASHEMGHNLGLGHDGTSTLGYYGGHGSGYVNWGPIMGASYYIHQSQWSKGEYTGANNTQDDVTIITNKLTLRTDDHGDTAANASTLSISATGSVVSTTPQDDPANANPANKGIIQSRTDVDAFAFDTAGGTVTLTATPARETTNTRGGNLDVQIVLRDSLGSLIADNDLTDDSHATISTTLAAGRYYLFVEGVGNTVTPYTDYASLGQYFINGTIPPDTGGVDLTPDAFTFTDQTDVARSTVLTSNSVTVTGIEAAAPISITNGEYSINGGDYTNAVGTVANNDTVTVRHTSSANYATITDTTLSIGGVSDTFSSTTLAAPIPATLTVTKTGTGTVSSTPTGINCGTDCAEDFIKDTSVTLTATPSSGYVLGSWSGACSGTSNTCTLTMDASKTATANFVKAYTLTLNKSGNGSVVSTPAGIDCGTDCSEIYNSGASITLNATPDSGYAFGSWSGCSTVSGTSCTVSMTAAKTVNATFKPLYALTVSKTGTGSGTVTGTGISCGTDCTENYASGTSVKLTATATTGNKFTGWSGACAGVTTSYCTVSMTEAKTASANFDIITYGLTVNKSGNGSITGTGVDCGADCTESYNTGTSVVLTATADAGYRFYGWSGCSTVSGTSCTVNMTSTKTVTATFKPIYTLTITKTGTGSGTVTGTGISCGTDCTENYASGTSVKLTATATTGNKFTGWSGACAGVTTSYCTVSMTEAKTASANFDIITYGLTVNKSGNGSITGTGVDCGADCTESYNTGTSVVLTATADAGYRFYGWSGCSTVSGTSCTVNMTSTKTVTATFKPIYTLTITKTGTGSGTVTGTGISCGDDCTEDYLNGTSVTLSAKADSGSRFTGWSGACSGTSSCKVTLSAAKDVTATFTSP